jgi:hypothetical protein
MNTFTAETHSREKPRIPEIQAIRSILLEELNLFALEVR